MKNEKTNEIIYSTISKSNISLTEYIRCELKRGYLLQNDEQRYRERREKFYIFLKIPYKLETFLFYGFFQCVDAFLFVLTFLPFRLILALISCLFRITNLLIKIFSTLNYKKFIQTIQILNSAETCDILKGLIILSSFYLMNFIEISMIYHQIKSQSIIKLYIFFNMLEVADKLLSSFGQDILDTLYWTATEPKTKKRQYLSIFFHLLLAIFYVFMHTILALLQATTLNVAINSKNKALITIMMSNNFVELKSMVFKKFEKNNLFHMSCSDVRERLHYMILLAVVIIQTMKEYNWNDKQFLILMEDCLMVLLVEIFVDWFKHAFVTRFNEITFDVYEEYSLSLAYDLVGSKLKSAFSDHSDIVSRRMGFTPLPLSVLLMKIFFSSFQFQDLYSCLCLVFLFGSLVLIKLTVNIVLVGISCKWVEEHQKTLETKVNKVLGGQSASLPASRHNSVSDLTILNEEKKLEEIRDKLLEQSSSSPSKQQQQNQCNNIDINNDIKTNPTIGGTRSTPHSPLNGSPRRTSLEDLTEQVAIVQNSLESSIILSDSTVSLISMNDGRNLPKLPTTTTTTLTPECEDSFGDENLPFSKTTTTSSSLTSSTKSNFLPRLAKSATKTVLKQYLKRRVSLQELPTNIINEDQQPTDYNENDKSTNGGGSGSVNSGNKSSNNSNVDNNNKPKIA